MGPWGSAHQKLRANREACRQPLFRGPKGARGLAANSESVMYVVFRRRISKCTRPSARAPVASLIWLKAHPLPLLPYAFSKAISGVRKPWRNFCSRKPSGDQRCTHFRLSGLRTLALRDQSSFPSFLIALDVGQLILHFCLLLRNRRSPLMDQPVLHFRCQLAGLLQSLSSVDAYGLLTICLRSACFCNPDEERSAGQP